MCNHVRDWVRGTPGGSWTSMGVVSDGSYGVQRGLVYSYPVTCAGGKWKVVQGESLRSGAAARVFGLSARHLCGKVFHAG